MLKHLLFSGFLFVAVAEAPGSAAAPSQREDYGSRPTDWTFTHDVAPVVFAHCVPCHHQGGPAPFGLLTYADVRKRARQIVQVTASRLMPPWLPEPGYGEFVGARRLSEGEIATFRQWLDSGATRGAPDDLPPRPRVSEGFELGPPDLVLHMPAPYTVPADGPDVFRNFVLPVPGGGEAQERYVRAVELLPGNSNVVHHAVMMIDPTPSSRLLEGRDPAPGFDGMVAFTNARSPDGQFLGWTPGKTPFAGYPDLAWRLVEGSDLVLQLHMLPSGRPEPIRASVGLYFARAAPTRRVLLLRLGSKTLDIPAGEEAYRIADSFLLPVDVKVLAVYPHAHYLAREMKAWATLPDGRQRWLLWIKDWDFNWQDQYRYVEPVSLPKGSRLEMVYTYDNSSGNVRNPNATPRRVRFGPQSSDEMGDLWLQLLPEKKSDFPLLQTVTARKEVSSNVDGFRLALSFDPGDQETRFNLGSALIEMGRFDDGIGELRRVLATKPDLAKAHTNLGNALFTTGKYEPALHHFRQAVRIEPRSETHFNLANGLMAAGRLGEALTHFDRVLKLDPNSTPAHLNKGIALSRLGRVEAEMAEYEKALSLDPEYLAAHYNLAQALSRAGRPDDALARLTLASALAPRSTAVLRAQAEILQGKGELERAADTYRQILLIDPNLTAAHLNLGAILAKQKLYRQAKEALQEALRLEPGNVRAQELLGGILAAGQK